MVSPAAGNARGAPAPHSVTLAAHPRCAPYHERPEPVVHWSTSRDLYQLRHVMKENVSNLYTRKHRARALRGALLTLGLASAVVLSACVMEDGEYGEYGDPALAWEDEAEERAIAAEERAITAEERASAEDELPSPDEALLGADLDAEAFAPDAVQLHTHLPIHFGGTFGEEDHNVPVGGLCTPGWTRVNPPTVMHAGHGYCNFFDWVNPGNDADCRAYIHLHHSAGFLYGDCNVDIFEQSTPGSGFSYSASNTNSAQQNTTSYDFTVAAGDLVTVATCGLTGTAFAGDTFLRLFSGAAEVASNDDACAGLGSSITFTAAAAGTLQVRAGCFGSGNCTGTVLVQITPGSFSYSASNTNSAQQNTVNHTVAVSAGKTIRFGTCTVPGSSGTGDTLLRLFNPSGVEVAAGDDNCGALSFVSHTATVSGDYQIRAGCYDSGSCTGTVVVTVQ
jgi:hypothetical protein